MKVNQIGIQSYQQLNRRDNAAIQKENSSARGTDSTLVIEPQVESSTSKLAIKAPDNSYAEYLTADEKRALDLLFSRFKDTGRFGAYSPAENENTATDATLGRIIDVKV